MATRDTRPMGSIRKDFGLDGDSRIGQPGVGVIVENELDESGLTGANKGVAATVPLSPVIEPTATGFPASEVEEALRRTRRPFEGTIKGVPTREIAQLPMPRIDGPSAEVTSDPFNDTSLGVKIDQLLSEEIAPNVPIITPNNPLIPRISFGQNTQNSSSANTIDTAVEANTSSNLALEFQAELLKNSGLEQDLIVLQRRHEEALTDCANLRSAIAEIQSDLDIANSELRISEKENMSNKDKIDELSDKLAKKEEQIRELRENIAGLTKVEVGPNDLVRISKLPKILQWAINIYFYFFKKNR